MFVVFFHRMPVLLAILYVLHLITYIGLFRKMKVQLGYAVIPFVAEWKMSNVVFKNCVEFAGIHTDPSFRFGGNRLSKTRRPLR